jgi:uncharacterized protein (DUF1684 family)
MSTLETFRQEKDDFFKNDYQSPLTAQERRDFTGLHYYPENSSLRLELALEKPAVSQSVILQTSTGDVREFMHAGQVRFFVGDDEALLQVYMDDYDNYFIPFVDATAPDETYGAGRYLEPRDISGGVGDPVLLVDFNFAYNPYCAYNERWSCPIPPRENRLKVRIEAGEKKFHDD